VADDERDVVLDAVFGEPVLAEHTLDAHDEAVAERGDGLEQGREATGQVLVQDDGAGRMQHADMHSLGVQVDAAVEWVCVWSKRIIVVSFGLGGA
jgi:hypothetical protein